MEIASQFGPSYLYAVGAMLFLAAFLGAWKVPVRWRIPWVIVWLVPALGLLMMAQHLAKNPARNRAPEPGHIRQNNCRMRSFVKIRKISLPQSARNQHTGGAGRADAPWRSRTRTMPITALPAVGIASSLRFTVRHHRPETRKSLAESRHTGDAKESITRSRPPAAAMTSVGGYDRSKAETILPLALPAVRDPNKFGNARATLGHLCASG